MFQESWAEEAPPRSEVEALTGPVLLEFGAEWCPHCQAVQPELRKLLAANAVTHLKIADGKGKPLGRAYKVKLWPNFVLIRDGEVLEQLARPDLETLSKAIESRLL